MPEYLVTWQIEVEAKSPYAAAKKAWKAMRRRHSIADVFDVQRKYRVRAMLDGHRHETVLGVAEKIDLSGGE